jgi:hypothetical protein
MIPGCGGKNKEAIQKGGNAIVDMVRACRIYPSGITK